MKEIEVPTRPAKLFQGFGGDSYEAKFEKDLREYQEKVFLVALDMLKALDDDGFKAASYLIARDTEWNELDGLSKDLDASKNQLRILIHAMPSSGKSESTGEMAALMDKLIELKRVEVVRSSQYAEKWIYSYNRIRRMKELLEKLASAGEDMDVSGSQFRHPAALSLFTAFQELRLNEDGIIRKDEDPVIDLLVGQDAKRIRKCKICSNFFWAKRLDARCCQKKCADTYNQRLSRERKAENGSLYRKAAKKRRPK
jgi:hypothetical protein